MNKKVISLILILTSFYCCNNTNLYSFYSNGLLQDVSNTKSYEYYIIIPYAGCPGCVTSAEELLKQNKNSKKYFFILTNYSSRKALILKLGKDILKYNNILLDSTNNYFSSSHNESIYPISIKLNKNNISKIIIGVP